ncbi:MAG: MmgE/PrpD family protein [Beijerinckiaceae bacterium]|nr:MmgE/PrpD family protein [Beijerinckiaceae bacterium]
MTSTHLQQLAGFASGLTYDQVSPAAAALIKRVLLDALGCAFAADGLDPGCAIVAEVFAPPSGGGPCTLFSSGARASATGAALVNGALVHSLNFDPIGTESGHTGVACMAGPFAMAEERDASGKDMIVAAIVAAEVSARITCAIVDAGRRPSDKFLAGQLLSYFGAAAGCGRILGLDAQQMESALCLALMQMSGSRQVIFEGDPPAKSIYGAFPAHGGVASALLAHKGMDARCDLFGPPAGLYPAIYGAQFDTASIADGLFDRYRFTDVEFKPWPASNQVIPFIDAALAACGAIGDLARVEEVVLVGNPHAKPWLEPLDAKLAPANIAAAANSAPYCVAAAMVAGRFDFAFVDAAGRSPEGIAALKSKFRVVYEDGRRGAAIIVRMADGASHSVSVEAPLGHPSKPLADAQHLEKFAQCCGLSRNPHVRRNRDRIAADFMNLEKLASVRDITRLMRGEG